MLALVQKLFERVGWVDGLILFRCIFACILEDDLGTTRVFRKESGALSVEVRESRAKLDLLGHIICSAMYDDPTRLATVVLRDLLTRELDILGVVAWVIHLVLWTSRQSEGLE